MKTAERTVKEDLIHYLEKFKHLLSKKGIADLKKIIKSLEEKEKTLPPRKERQCIHVEGDYDDTIIGALEIDPNRRVHYV